MKNVGLSAGLFMKQMGRSHLIDVVKFVLNKSTTLNSIGLVISYALDKIRNLCNNGPTD